MRGKELATLVDREPGLKESPCAGLKAPKAVRRMPSGSIARTETLPVRRRMMRGAKNIVSRSATTRSASIARLSA